MPGSRDLAHITTIDATESRDGGPSSRVPALTVLYHPDLSRVGEIARLLRSGSDGLSITPAEPVKR